MTRRELLGGSAFSLPSLSRALQAQVSPYRRPKLKITAVKTAEFVVHGLQLLVKVETDQGIFGIGEGTDAVQGGSLILKRMERLLIGEDPLNIDYLWERFRTFGVFAGAQSGQYIAALTAVEIALWDLAGKAVGLPVYQLLGGKMRDRIRVYCDSELSRAGDAGTEKTIDLVKKMGFTALKIDIDDRNDPFKLDKVNWTASNGEIDNMVRKVRFVRETFPKQVDLAVDMHARYDMGSAKRAAKELEPFRLMWLEEPVPAENVQAMRDVRESTSTPICTGENVFLRHGFRPLLEARAVDIIEPDIQKCGGLLEARKIADMAHTYYVPVAPHCVVSPIGTMASAHVCAAIPNFLVLEWHWINHYDLWKEWVTEGDLFDNGYIPIPERPGLGVTLNETAARKAQAKGTQWF